MNIEKLFQILFSAAFLAMLAVPLLATDLRPGAISEAEKRKLAEFPSLYDEDGSLNGGFPSEFETWINDRIGFRSDIVIANAKIQYYLFDQLSNNSDMYLGPKGEFNYATEEILRDYQHLNLYSEDSLKNIAEAYQTVKDYTEQQGAKFYYFQCWDKQSIYPEYFPDTVLQYGEESKTDGIVKALKTQTDVTVISPKQELLDGKSFYDTYSRWGDATHWTQRGAYIGYIKLMNTINAQNGDRYKVLTENDYDIIIKDQGNTLFGGIHKEDMLESFSVKKPQAVETKEKLTLLCEDQRHRFFTNQNVANNTRVLILGDSYINSFIVEDIAESFYETILIWGDYNSRFTEIMEVYQPDIVIVENAERCDRSGGIVNAAESIRQK